MGNFFPAVTSERDGSKVFLYIFLMEKSEFKDHEYKFCDKTMIGMESNDRLVQTSRNILAGI